MDCSTKTYTILVYQQPNQTINQLTNWGQPYCSFKSLLITAFGFDVIQFLVFFLIILIIIIIFFFSLMGLAKENVPTLNILIILSDFTVIQHAALKPF